ncbi:hypothetical protein PCL_07072 [Purpureocillium lilacinum]|uniref:LysM domain-containing protein n=1 Tax=Purpureocillium lilacinum TaxID=33203 RepID=A0A2U3DT91_PURLI|nr:hypothetical protein PCL_07072 [Purpureocillium lilacinum]
MRLRVWSCYIAAASACNPEQNGHWVVRDREHAAEAARVLGIRLDDLAKINRVGPTRLNKIYPGETYTVPYVASLAQPATWNVKSITTGTPACLAYLELSPSPTFTAQVKAAAGSDILPLPPQDHTCRSSGSKFTTNDNPTGSEPESRGLLTRASASLVETTTPSLTAAVSGTSAATDCASKGSSTCLGPARSAATASSVSGPYSSPSPATFCIDEQLEPWRPGFNLDRQAGLARLFCGEKRPPLSSKNPGYARELEQLPAKAYAEGGYYYSLLWTGWDQNCTAETIDTETCIDIMKQNFQKCNNGGKGGITKFGCVLYEFRGFFSWEYPPDPKPTRTTDTDAPNASTIARLAVNVLESVPVSSDSMGPRESTLSHTEAVSKGSSVIDPISRVSTVYDDAAQSSGTTTDASAPHSKPSAVTFCAAQENASRRIIIDPGKQTHLLNDFCRHTRKQLSSENPGYLTYYYWETDRMRDRGFYFFYLRWTGWDQRCPAEETIDPETCIDVMGQNFKSCCSRSGLAGGLRATLRAGWSSLAEFNPHGLHHATCFALMTARPKLNFCILQYKPLATTLSSGECTQKGNNPILLLDSSSSEAWMRRHRKYFKMRHVVILVSSEAPAVGLALTQVEKAYRGSVALWSTD